MTDLNINAGDIAAAIRKNLEGFEQIVVPSPVVAVPPSLPHAAIARASGNPLLVEMYGKVLARLFGSEEFDDLLTSDQNRDEVTKIVEQQVEVIVNGLGGPFVGMKLTSGIQPDVPFTVRSMIRDTRGQDGITGNELAVAGTDKFTNEGMTAAAEHGRTPRGDPSPASHKPHSKLRSTASTLPGRRPCTWRLRTACPSTASSSPSDRWGSWPNPRASSPPRWC